MRSGDYTGPLNVLGQDITGVSGTVTSCIPGLTTYTNCYDYAARTVYTPTSVHDVDRLLRDISDEMLAELAERIPAAIEKRLSIHERLRRLRYPQDKP